MSIKIKETFCSYTGEIDTGRFAFFISMDNNGVELSIDSIIEQAIHFPRIVLLGEPFEQKNEVAKLIKKLIKQNPYIVIEINTKGTIRPIGIGLCNNIVYNVNLQLKYTNLDINKRLDSTVINWFTEMGANFKFEVRNEDDIDEVMMIVNTYGIKKSQVFLVPLQLDNDSIHFILKLAKHLGFNIALKFHMLWKTDGRE